MDSAVSARLQAAVEAQVAAGAPGALVRIEAPRASLMWGGSAGQPPVGRAVPCARTRPSARRASRKA
jgi:hypothetical protein